VREAALGAGEEVAVAPVVLGRPQGTGTAAGGRSAMRRDAPSGSARVATNTAASWLDQITA